MAFAMKWMLATATMAATAAVAAVVSSVPNVEIEPNESKASATVADSGGPGMADGDTITGTSTGNFVGFGGLFSVDYFRVKTEAATPRIYRHRLSLSAPLNSYSASIRGRNQGEFGIGLTDVMVQTAQSGDTTPPRFVQWYGFGKAEELYYRVSGTPQTVMPYTVTLQTEPVAVVVAGAPVVAGPIMIGSDTGNQNDIDFWVYDAELNPVPTFGGDEPNTATRTLSPGTYYIAWSDWNLANNQSNPTTETFFDSSVLDFAGIVVCSSQTTLPMNDLKITSSSGTVTVAVGKPGMFDIAFVQFVVVEPPPTPMGLSGSTGSVRRGGPGQNATPWVTISAVVNAGANPASSGVAVTADLSLVGGGAAPLHDDGTDGDAVAGDGVWTLRFDGTMLPAGTSTLPLIAVDAQARTALATAAVVVYDVQSSDLGLVPFDDSDRATAATLRGSGDVCWVRFAIGEAAAEPERFVDVYTGGSGALDTKIALFDAGGNLLAENDNWDVGFSRNSGLSFGRRRPLRLYPVITSLDAPVGMAGQNGPLAAGQYYLSIAEFVGTFGPGFGVEFGPGVGVGVGAFVAHVVTSTSVPPPVCAADINFDGIVDGGDFTGFVNSFTAGDATADARADVNGDGTIDGDDFVLFVNAFGAGC